MKAFAIALIVLISQTTLASPQCAKNINKILAETKIPQNPEITKVKHSNLHMLQFLGVSAEEAAVENPRSATPQEVIGLVREKINNQCHQYRLLNY